MYLCAPTMCGALPHLPPRLLWLCVRALFFRIEDRELKLDALLRRPTLIEQVADVAEHGLRLILLIIFCRGRRILTQISTHDHFVLSSAALQTDHPICARPTAPVRLKEVCGQAALDAQQPLRFTHGSSSLTALRRLCRPALWRCAVACIKIDRRRIAFPFEFGQLDHDLFLPLDRTRDVRALLVVLLVFAARRVVVCRAVALGRFARRVGRHLVECIHYLLSFLCA